MQADNWKRKLKNVLFMDLKTVASTAKFNQLDARLQRQWGQKISLFRKEENWSVQEWYDNRASYYAEYGRILGIAFGGLYWDDNEVPHLKVKTLFEEDERKLLQQFVQVIERYPADELSLCAHNGREFDYPFFCRRLMIQGLPLPKTLQLTGRKPWENPHLDTLELWRFGDSRHYVPLEVLAAVLNLPTEQLELTGDQVSRIYYEEGDVAKIRKYALESVVTLVQTYLRLIGAPLIEEANITRVD
ncbi:ribonuclease H-like domain-containing protein [Tellurirhabdus bombi]|uniref:ribonuclease H-like domain-containing protein n=1 Tax=Tellurirhabdus bombi TaxID=2907205 RepID=UPI001F392A2D|nr:ribonuclease H-like domain-containing protein [Tellurirhabdus bombi]